MIPPHLVERFRRAERDIVSLAQKDILEVWRNLDYEDARKATDVALSAVRDVVDAYGSASSGLAADFYDDVREASGVRPSYRASPSAVAPRDQTDAMVRWGTGPLWSDNQDPDAAFSRISGGAGRLVQQPSRDTIWDNATSDPAKPRFARVPRSNACSFCQMLASRGAVYVSERSAGLDRSYHDHCYCLPVPVFSLDDLPEINRRLQEEWEEATAGAYGPDEARRMWEQHVRDAGGFSGPPKEPGKLVQDFKDYNQAAAWAEARGMVLDETLLNRKTIEEFQLFAEAYETIAARYPQIVDNVVSVEYLADAPGIAARVFFGRYGRYADDFSPTTQSRVGLSGMDMTKLRNSPNVVATDGYQAMIHEMAHVVQAATPHLRQVAGSGAKYAPGGRSQIGEALKEAGYAKGRSIDRGLLGRDISNYAVTGNHLETHAEIFTLFNRPQGLAGLSSDTVKRLNEFRDALNRRIPGAL